VYVANPPVTPPTAPDIAPDMAAPATQSASARMPVSQVSPSRSSAAALSRSLESVRERAMAPSVPVARAGSNRVRLDTSLPQLISVSVVRWTTSRRFARGRFGNPYFGAMQRILVLLGIGLSVALAACSGQRVNSSDPSSASTTDVGVGASQPTVEAPDDLMPGMLDVRTVVMSDGTEITYGLILPDGFDPAEEYPVVLALPPGSQTVDLTISLAASTYEPEALDRGWVVITPAAPNGTLFFQGSERYIPEFLDTQAWIRPEGGRYHLTGVSNGGRSVFRIAGLNPDRFASILVYPGYPSSPADQAALPDLVDLPFAMFVGGEDAAWIDPMIKARDRLESLGASVSFEIRDGEAHIMASLSDGADIFDFLDSVRE